MDGSFDPARTAFEALGAGAVDAAGRRAHLLALRGAVRARAEDLARAVDADFGGRPRAETMLAEVGLALASIDWAARRVAGWARPQRVRLPAEFLGSRGWVERVPLGRVAVLAPWNYPVQLALLPIIAALSGGNRVLLKPSEHAPRTGEVLAEVVGVLPADVVQVIQGGPEVARAVTALPLDGLFFTGSTETGRMVARAAAEGLVPTVLELGGKSPAIVLPGADLDAAASSLMAGKLFSAGQTCVAPDYVLVPRSDMDALIAALGRATLALYPDPDGGDYAALLRTGARERLLGLMEGHDAVALMGPVAASRMGAFAVRDPDPASALMKEEIFGPVLPVVPYDDLAQAEAFVSARPVPLALYAFGDRALAERIVGRLRSGGAAVNDCVVQVAAHTLPFGGAGTSGWGSYHGEEGFRSFTRPRSTLVAGRWSPVRMARPPYGAAVGRIIRLLLR